jgi:hypothetical protein
MRIFVVRDSGISHKFFEFGAIPAAVDPVTADVTR